MAEPKYDYDVGSIFCVPLRDGGYAYGVAARCDKQGLVFGYFFEPRLDSEPPSGLDADLHPENAILVGQFGDIGLKNGEWRIVGTVKPWRPENWPMPPFVSAADEQDCVTLTEYDENTFETKSVSTLPRSAETENLPVDRVMGYGSVEIRLTRILEAPQE